MSNYQFNLLNSTVRNQETLSNKQNADSTAGVVANDLLQSEYTEATTVLTIDQDITNQNSPSSGGSTNWNTNESNNFSINNAQYQNDAAVSQTGETNASTSVQQLQTQVSQDATNISNLASLAQTIIQIGQYVAGLIGQAYT